MKRVLAHGTFDIIHYGHINYLEKAKSYGEYLIVVISSDKFLKEKTDKVPYFNEEKRLKVISAIKGVDEVILKDDYINKELIKKLNVDVFVTTDIGFNYDHLNSCCKVVVVERTKNVSSSEIKKHLKLEN